MKKDELTTETPADAKPVLPMEVLKKLNLAQAKYEKAMGEARNSIADKVDFNFSVQWQPSDGWTIVDDNSNVAPMEYVLSVIKRKGRLSYEDFKDGAI